jgi:transcriptional regulator of acetoin/glycerol metabolism
VHQTTADAPPLDPPDRLDTRGPDVPSLFVVLECDRPLAGGERYSLQGVDDVTIGRGSERRVHHDVSNAGRTTLVLQLPSSRLSSSHARIFRDGDRWTIEDVASRNGTYVNLRQITRETLRDGDVIELGHVLLRFRILATPHAMPAEPIEPARRLLGFHTLLPDHALHLRELALVARSPLSILLLGETGTGKEVIARSVHELSLRPGPFIAVNCGALSGSLLDAQLFGHVRGSFTGAVRDEPGFVRASDRGTLFLDEIGDLPGPAQAALLRVLQEHEVVPVGGTRPVKVDLRVIAATHRPLDLLAARGDFRTDLYARLSGHIHWLAPLRERREDLGVIVADLLPHVAHAGAPPQFGGDAGRELITNPWPLNIRQLQQSLMRAVALTENGLIQAHHLVSSSRPLDALLDPDERERADQLRALLEQHRGNVSKVARSLGCSRMQVHRWMQRYTLDPDSFRN